MIKDNKMNSNIMLIMLSELLYHLLILKNIINILHIVINSILLGELAWYLNYPFVKSV